MIRHASSADGRPLTRNERRRIRTRKQLLEAAAELLVETGYDDLTIQRITDRADLARATFYIYFKDKEEAVWAILEESFSELVQIQREIKESDPQRYRLVKWRRIFEYVAAHRPLLQTLMSDRGHIKLNQRIAAFMVATLEDDLRSGRVERTTELSFKFEANFFAGAMMQVVSWWLTRDQALTPAEMANMVFEIIMRKSPPT